MREVSRANVVNVGLGFRGIGLGITAVRVPDGHRGALAVVIEYTDIIEYVA